MPPEELYDVALALLAKGFSNRMPHYVRRAQQLLLAVQEASQDLDLSLELAVCARLLGDVQPLGLLLQVSVWLQPHTCHHLKNLRMSVVLL